MMVLLFLISIAAGVTLKYMVKVSSGILLSAANFLFVYTITFNLAYWFYAFGNIPKGLLKTLLDVFIAYGKFPSYFLLGYLIARITDGLKHHNITENNYSPILKSTLWSVAFAVASIFIMATVGKIQSLAQMQTFFHDSGYSNSFLYFIMVAESGCAIGILLHCWLKTGLWATTGLFLIMTGAVYTHWHNHDPFSDSYAAIAQLITLSLLLILYLFEKRANAISVVVGSVQ